jgi:predicted metal-dependent HD superfamily phosphohydrolase
LTQEYLAKRFAELWGRCADNNSAADTLWRDIESRYSEPHRHYHNLDHIRQCLGQLDRAGEVIAERDATELAIWFHDIIYRYGAKDNEELSAMLFRDAARAVMPASLVKRVSNFILATKHTGAAEDEPTAYLVDIDLSGFGLPWEGYLADSDALRLEAPGSTDTQYYQGKQRFLNELIAWPRIFQTDYFNDRLEQQARDNIGRYLGQLEAETLTS